MNSHSGYMELAMSVGKYPLSFVPAPHLVIPKMMREGLTHGLCKLCLKGNQLQKSHYLPAALYASPKKS
jgi:hypothetical protein